MAYIINNLFFVYTVTYLPEIFQSFLFNLVAGTLYSADKTTQTSSV